MLINARICASIKCVGDDPYCEEGAPVGYVAAFGIGSSVMSIVLLASSLCFVYGLFNILP